MPPFITRVLSACCGVMILSLVYASAGADSHRAQSNGLDAPGLRQPGVGDTPQLKGSVAQPVAVPQAAIPVTVTPQQVELADPTLASTATKREQLTYLVRCALPEDIELYSQQGTERFTFQGRMGLAPRWLYEAMTPSEERWVSACLLAHVNYYGKHVMVSMRATPPVVPALQAPEEEQQTFSIFEGGAAISSCPIRWPIPVWVSARPPRRRSRFYRTVFVPGRRAPPQRMARPSPPAAF